MNSPSTYKNVTRIPKKVSGLSEVADIPSPRTALLHDIVRIKRSAPTQAVTAAPVVRAVATIEPEITEQPELLNGDKRSFLKVAGVVGLGVVAASVLPQKAEAYVMGGAPTTGVVGVKNSANVRVDPATEATLTGVKTQTDKLAFDGSNNLQVGGDIGIQNASNVIINPATEDTLALIKTQTNKLTFDGSNNLLTASSGGAASAVGLKDVTNTQVNPATDDAILYLRRMVKLMESQATVDAGNRQRITLDSLGTNTAITTTVPVSGTVTATVSLSAGANAIGAITNLATLAGQNQQMFQDVARNAYATGTRQNLSFS